MAKRNSDFRYNSSIFKKPKLELSHEKPSSSRFVESKENSPQRKSIQNDFKNVWDDDDDIILLASQKYEEMERRSQQIIVEQQEHSFNVNLTYAKFGQNMKTSTQITKPATSSVDEFYQDCDVFFTEIDEIPGERGKEISNNQQLNIESTKSSFEKSKPVHGNNQDQIGDLRDEKTPGSDKKSEEKRNSGNDTNNDRKRKNAKDIQIDYFSSRLDTLRKENEKLSKDILELNEKLQTKDGEVTMLRYDLKYSKDLNHKLRVENIQNNDLIKKEWQDKISELEKLVEGQQAELKFKKANFTSKNVISNLSTHVKRVAILSSLYKLHLSMEYQVKKEAYRNIDIPVEVYDNSKSKEQQYSFTDSIFQQELNLFQNVLAQIQACETLNKDLIKHFQKQISQSLRKCTEELKDYIRGLDYPKYRDTSALVEYKFLCQNVYKDVSSLGKNIFKETVLFPGEKAILARRYFATFALICDSYKDVTEILNTKNNNILGILIESIKLIGFSKELFHHFGLIESLAIMLKSLTQRHFINEYDAIQLLKYLIFCRPNIRPLVAISETLSIISQQQYTSCRFIMNSLCLKDNEKGLLSINEYYKILQFPPNSCSLQIYGVLLEVAFPQYTVLNQSQIDLLTILCKTHFEFTRNCIDNQIHWIFEKKNDANLCDCYTRVAISFIILFHLILKHWIHDANCVDFRKISKISRIGLMLLYNIFKINYRREVLQIGGIAVKNRIKIIHNWLTEHKSILGFRSTQVKALEFLKASHVMMDSLKSFEDSTDQRHSSIWETNTYSNRVIIELVIFVFEIFTKM